MFKYSIITLLAVGLLLYSLPTAGLSNGEKDAVCPFCNQNILDYQKFYEDELVVALFTHKPVFAGHSLIIPKRHVEYFDMLSDEEIMHIGRVIKKVNKAAMEVFGNSAYLILQKNGREVGQTVPHVHFHYIPRNAGDDSTIAFFIRMYIANFKSPMESAQMQSQVEKMQIVMQNE